MVDTTAVATGILYTTGCSSRYILTARQGDGTASTSNVTRVYERGSVCYSCRAILVGCGPGCTEAVDLDVTVGDVENVPDARGCRV